MRAFVKKLIRRHRKTMPAGGAPLAAIDARLGDWEAALQLLRDEADEATTRVRLSVLRRAERGRQARDGLARLRAAIAPGTRGWRRASARVRERLERLGRVVAGELEGEEGE